MHRFFAGRRLYAARSVLGGPAPWHKPRRRLDACRARGHVGGLKGALGVLSRDAAARPRRCAPRAPGHASQHIF